MLKIKINALQISDLKRNDCQTCLASLACLVSLACQGNENAKMEAEKLKDKAIIVKKSN
jgi:hypothetical protein